MSKAEALAGGVFIGSALLHLIPESLHSLEHPLASIVSLICFILLLAVELIAGSHPEHSDSTELLRSSEEARPKREFHPYATMATGRIASVTWVLYFVLIFHGFVEAIAFGVIESTSVLLALFCAIIGHKPVETFALGLQLLKSRPSRGTYMALMAGFSAVAPVTIFVAMELGKNASKLFSGVVTSASAGAFLFVGCHELGELLHHAQKWALSGKIVHLGFFIAGAVWMAIFVLIGGEHEH
jgi:zinc transporter 1/2/3